jgi:hypothetical protein
LIRRREQGLDFCPREKRDQRPREPLAGHCQHPLNLGGVRRHLQGRVSKEGMECGEAQIPGPHAGPLPFQVIQKRDDQRRIQLLEAQPCRRAMQPVLGELQELAKGIAVGPHGVRTRLALLHETLGEEALQERREAGRRGHG